MWGENQAYCLPAPKYRRACEGLERLGLMEGELVIASRNYEKGTTLFKRGYRLTLKGKQESTP